MFKVGASRIPITPELAKLSYDLVMLGWGDPKHKAKTVETEIYSRAVAFEADGDARLIFVCVELCFVTESLRRGVMERLTLRYSHLNIQESELVITATHTHNGPAGYCHSILYSAPSMGYYPEVYNRIVVGITESIVQAWNKRVNAELKHSSDVIPLSEPVAFNRAIYAWNKNPDVTHHGYRERDQALDRTMDVLLAVDEQKKPIALISWFAVHCTSVHRDFFGIHSDNKGVASQQIEKLWAEQGSPDGIAIFAQGASGDVSPNYQRYFLKRETRGKYRDDLKSCEYNAKIQSDFALALIAKAKPLQGFLPSLVTMILLRCRSLRIL